MFERFPSLTRFSHGWTITEKLDGTNAAVVIMPFLDSADAVYADRAVAKVGDTYVFAQSRSKLIWPGKSTDNHGFARFVQENAEEFVEKLGEGRHFGEWVGKGVNKRHYNLTEKQFALFNVKRWKDQPLPQNVTTVPVFYLNEYLDNPGQTALDCMHRLQVSGSLFGPKDKDGVGFVNPEGVVMYHHPSNTAFKKTFEYDELGKWAENMAAKA